MADRIELSCRIPAVAVWTDRNVDRSQCDCIYATESFVDAVRSLGLTDIAFEEIAW